MLEVERNRYCDFVHGSSKNGTSPMKLYFKVSRFKKSDGVVISFVEAIGRNSFY